MNELIEITGLIKAYDANHVAVNNVSLTLPRGKIVGLLGPNGSGKTTLIKMLNGLLTPTQGSIRIGGQPVGVETKAHVAYLPDRTYLSGNKKVTQILDFFCDFYADFSRERAVGMLQSLGVDPNARMGPPRPSPAGRPSASSWPRSFPGAARARLSTFWMSPSQVWIPRPGTISCGPS